MVDGFQRGLCGTDDLGAATATARDAGAALWQAAVQRAQGVAVAGTIDRYDDRPLYWARVTVTRALREWLPAFELTSPQLPGGHLHISALVYPDDPGALTGPAFEADRRAVVDQTVALVEAAGRAVAP